MNADGNIYAFEGVDGSGKSTLAAAALKILHANGADAKLLAFPGRESNTLGELIYRLHHDSGSVGVSAVTPTALQAAHIAAHLDAIERTILPALSCGKCIVLDRYWWSTAVYGSVDGARQDILEALIRTEQLLWNDVRPAVVFHVRRSAPLRPEPIERWLQLKQRYESIARAEALSQRIETIDNEHDLDTAIGRLRNILT